MCHTVDMQHTDGPASCQREGALSSLPSPEICFPQNYNNFRKKPKFPGMSTSLGQILMGSRKPRLVNSVRIVHFNIVSFNCAAFG